LVYTPRPGFEPGYPEGNKLSVQRLQAYAPITYVIKIAQYQIVPPRQILWSLKWFLLQAQSRVYGNNKTYAYNLSFYSYLNVLLF